MRYTDINPIALDTSATGESLEEKNLSQEISGKIFARRKFSRGFKLYISTWTSNILD